jgi:hypothetical protein
VTEAPSERPVETVESLLNRANRAESALQREQTLRTALSVRVTELQEERDRLQSRLDQIEEEK